MTKKWSRAKKERRELIEMKQKMSAKDPTKYPLFRHRSLHTMVHFQVRTAVDVASLIPKKMRAIDGGETGDSLNGLVKGEGRGSGDDTVDAVDEVVVGVGES